MIPAVLLISYGTPGSIGEVEAYYTHIMRGKTPPREKVEALKRKYMAIGGKSPLLEIAKRQAAALEKKLAEDGMQVKVYVGMNHSHPFIPDVIGEIQAGGHGELIAVPLAPYYTKASTGNYRKAVDDSLGALKAKMKMRFVDSWHLNPSLIDTWKRLIEERIGGDSGGSYLLFTAHSIPERLVQVGDPYEKQLLETVNRLVEMLGLERWGIAYQSASPTGEKWLGPSLEETLRELTRRKVAEVLVAPLGFIAEHLEVLYDIDIEAAQLADHLGLRLRRTGMPNDDPRLIAALASLINENL